MKSFFWCLLLQLTGIIAFAQESAHPAASAAVPEYTLTDQGSSIKFTIKNLGFKVEGSFTGLQGKVRFDPKDLSTASFEASIDASTVNTDNSMRDNHLKKDDYFDVQNYPRIRFVSTSVRAADKSDHYVITGKLTIKNATRDVSIPFVAAPAGNDYIFSGEFKIDRKDFNIGGSSTISNTLTVALTVLARK